MYHTCCIFSLKNLPKINPKLTALAQDNCSVLCSWANLSYTCYVFYDFSYTDCTLKKALRDYQGLCLLKIEQKKGNIVGINPFLLLLPKIQDEEE